ncbi:hypothetical protein [Thiohalorhabdus methylotrophus]|uniref:hypothetical protein n=1 Tax=Thiohalorhabdus methylotrophus TaxID=3242694 RepID=UPI0035A0CDDA
MDQISQSGWDLRETTTFPMVLHGMNQFAHMMMGLRPDLAPAESAEQIHAILGQGRAAVWLPARDPDVVRHREQKGVSCDSLSASLARRLPADCLFLVKKHALESGPVSSEWLARKLMVDEAFPKMLSEIPCTTWVGSVADHRTIRQMLYSRVVSGTPVIAGPGADKGTPEG